MAIDTYVQLTYTHPHMSKFSDELILDTDTYVQRMYTHTQTQTRARDFKRTNGVGPEHMIFRYVFPHNPSPKRVQSSPEESGTFDF